SQGRLELSDVTVSANLRNEGILVSADRNSIEGTFENAPDAQLQIATASGLPSTLTVAHGFANEGQIDLLSVEAADGSRPAATLAISSGLLVNTTDGLITSNPEAFTESIINGSVLNSGTIEIEIGRAH